MSIHQVTGSLQISDQGDQRRQFFDDSAELELQILEYLLRHRELTELQAREVLASLINAGEDIRGLALGIQNGDIRAIGQIELYIP